MKPSQRLVRALRVYGRGRRVPQRRAPGTRPQLVAGWSARADELADRYPDWTLVGSELRGLWAMSRLLDVPAGCPETLSADSIEAMEQQLAEATTLMQRLRCH
ncbi:hypothetical protein GCM10023334_042430 [Nonomuraea thailandensis]